LLLLLGLLCHRSLWLCRCLRFGLLSDRLGLFSTTTWCGGLLGLKLGGSCGLRVITTLLCELLQLTLGWCLCIFIGECHKESTSLHLLKKARKMLHVVKPSEGMRELKLLKVSQTDEILSHMCMAKDVCRGDGMSNEEHSGLQV
jgi:hypothetical protein